MASASSVLTSLTVLKSSFILFSTAAQALAIKTPACASTSRAQR